MFYSREGILHSYEPETRGRINRNSYLLDFGI